MIRTARGGGDEGGDRALHVDRAAAVEQVAAYFGSEGVGGPALAGRHDVEVPGEGEVASAGTARGQQIFDRAVRALRRP